MAYSVGNYISLLFLILLPVNALSYSSNASSTLNDASEYDDDDFLFPVIAVTSQPEVTINSSTLSPLNDYQLPFLNDLGDDYSFDRNLTTSRPSLPKFVTPIETIRVMPVTGDGDFGLTTESSESLISQIAENDKIEEISLSYASTDFSDILHTPSSPKPYLSQSLFSDVPLEYSLGTESPWTPPHPALHVQATSTSRFALHDDLTTDRKSNMTSSSSSSSSSSIWSLMFEVEDPLKSAIVGICLGLICVATVAGNCLVLAAVCGTTGQLRGTTTTHYFVGSLAVADLLLGIAVLPFSASLEATGRWSFGLALCDVWAALDVLCCTASILSLCAISVDRYVGVTRPLRHSTVVSERRATVVVVGVWLLSFALSVAPLFGWKEPRQPDADPTVCEVVAVCINLLLALKLPKNNKKHTTFRGFTTLHESSAASHLRLLDPNRSGAVRWG